MATPRVGFVLERSLGHKTHADNLKALLPKQQSIDAEIMEIDWEIEGWRARVPVFNSNWTVRSSLRARRQIQQARRDGALDALFIHTQVPAVLVADLLETIPTVVSVDATPLQYDELGAHYGHEAGGRRIEKIKWRANQRVFERACHIVSWSEWAKAGIVSGYGIGADKITVVPPGVMLSIWERPSELPRDDGTVRILFVGGDLERKGGTVLLEAFARLQAELAADAAWRDTKVQLDLVTKSDVAQRPGVVVHRDLTANSPDLVELFHRAAVFCLPTRGDCLPMVLSEAAAAGLPLVSTAVGAIAEIVRDGETGFLVMVDDVDDLTRRLSALVKDPELRHRMGSAAHRLATTDYDAEKNVGRLSGILVDAASAERRRSTAGRRRVLLTVSGHVPVDVAGEVDRGERPSPDYVAMAHAMDADLLDVAEARRRAGRAGALIERVAGTSALLAWVCLRERSQYGAVLTDGEQVGLPLAMLCRFAFRRPFGHVMIVHILSVPKKALLYRLLRLGRYIDTMVLYSSEQQRFIVEELGFPVERTVLSSFAVDTEFFDPDRVEPHRRRLISSAGLEYRDYPTLIAAAEGLDARVVIAAASPWSKRGDSTAGADLPDNVEVCRLGFVDLRQLYADSDLVVVPLHDVAFQAGVTTILEAMAMGKAVVCSRSRGQTDLIDDGTTGLYVPPGEPGPLREAITGLLDDPARAAALGAEARRHVQEVADVRTYAHRLASVVAAVARRHDPSS